MSHVALLLFNFVAVLTYVTFSVPNPPNDQSFVDLQSG